MSNQERLNRLSERRLGTAPLPPVPEEQQPLPVSPPPASQPPEPQKRKGETMQEKLERDASQATIYIYQDDLDEIDALHHSLAGLLIKESRKHGVKNRRGLQKYETWRSVVRVALNHLDEVRANILAQRNL